MPEIKGSSQNKDKTIPAVLRGGGEMGKIIRELDWSKTPLGAINTWPQSLYTALGIMLNCQLPMFLMWGENYISFYNDAYRPTLGNSGKHPKILGKPGSDVWPESWHVVKGLIDNVFHNGKAVLMEDQLIPIFRNGKMEDVYWTFSYSPVIGESGTPEGVFIASFETTKVIAKLKPLEEDSRYLQLALEIADLGVFKIDIDQDTAMYSQKAMKWFGLDEQSHALSEIFSRIHEEDRSRVIEAIERSIAGENEGRHDLQYRIIDSKTKELIHLRSVGQVFSSGEKPYISGIIQDITKENRAKDALKESKDRFQAAFDAIEGILWTNNANGEMEGEQPAWAAITGQSYEEYQGYGWAKAVHPDDAQPTIEAWNKAVEKKEIFLFEHRVRLKDGNWGYFSIRAIPLFNPDNSIREWVGVHTNITERKLAEIALKESEELFRSLADQSPMIVFLIEPVPEIVISYFNKSWLEYTGQNFEEALGKSWNGIVHPDDIQGILEIYDEAFKERRPYTLPAVRLRRYDGELHWHMFKANPRYLSNGDFIGYVGVGIDIHDQKLAHEQLELNNAQLKRINNDLDNFIYTASHDLKAPMSNIEGIMNALRNSLEMEKCLLNEETEMLFHLMDNSINRFKTTIQDLTEISKAQRGEEEDIHELDLEDIIDDVKFSIQDKIAESNARIEINLSQVKSIKFSRKNIKSIIYNLLSNAIKYRDYSRTPEVFIATENTDNYVVLSMKDNGLGMHNENLDKIFTMFKRFHDHVEGSGVGMYIVKRIIDNAGGKIEVESEVGVGTTFKVYFEK